MEISASEPEETNTAEDPTNGAVSRKRSRVTRNDTDSLSNKKTKDNSQPVNPSTSSEEGKPTTGSCNSSSDSPAMRKTRSMIAAEASGTRTRARVTSSSSASACSSKHSPQTSDNKRNKSAENKKSTRTRGTPPKQPPATASRTQQQVHTPTPFSHLDSYSTVLLNKLRCKTEGTNGQIRALQTVHRRIVDGKLGLLPLPRH
jgi:hypothetical protein